MKKNKNLNLKEMEQLFNHAQKNDKDKLIGFIGTIPVYENPNCPPGIIYMLDDTFLKMNKDKTSSRKS